MQDDNQKMVSVAETSYPSKDNITILTPSAMDTRGITYEFP